MFRKYKGIYCSFLQLTYLSKLFYYLLCKLIVLSYVIALIYHLPGNMHSFIVAYTYIIPYKTRLVI